VFERQAQMGIVTEKAELSPLNPYANEKGPDGQDWPELDTVRPWDSLSGDEKRLFSRMAEVYAGFLSHADHELGRLLDHLERSGELDNTLIVLVSDNGASGEGGSNGSVNENKIFNGLPDLIEEALPFLDDLGSHIRDEKVGEGWIKTQPGKFSLAGEGLNIGKEGAEPVTDDYPGEHPWAFVGGTIERAAVDVSGTPFVDLATEAKAAFARD
jgi:arylsulfatase A-like enzyme